MEYQGVAISFGKPLCCRQIDTQNIVTEQKKKPTQNTIHRQCPKIRKRELENVDESGDANTFTNIHTYNIQPNNDLKS